MYFAIQRKHDEEYDISNVLHTVYGSDINIISFEKLTDGNLRTAYISCIPMEDKIPLVVLDGDNKYDDNDIMEHMFNLRLIDDSMMITCFDPIDDSTKWAFAITENGVVKEIREKDPIALTNGGLPMIGTFFFQSTIQFKRYAEFMFKASLEVWITWKRRILY